MEERMLAPSGNHPSMPDVITSRRQFLIATAGVAAAVSLPTAMLAAESGRKFQNPSQTKGKQCNKGIDEDFVPELRPAERAIIHATQGAWNSACLADKVSAPAWTTKHSWFIAAADDRMLPPEYEQAVAKHIHATTTTLAAGHVPMLSKPQQVAAVIIEAANTLFTALDAAHTGAQSVFPANFQ